MPVLLPAEVEAPTVWADGECPALGHVRTSLARFYGGSGAPALEDALRRLLHFFGTPDCPQDLASLPFAFTSSRIQLMKQWSLAAEERLGPPSFGLGFYCFSGACTRWTEPKVQVFLGPSGVGKSLLLRSLAAATSIIYPPDRVLVVYYSCPARTSLATTPLPSLTPFEVICHALVRAGAPGIAALDRRPAAAEMDRLLSLLRAQNLKLVVVLDDIDACLDGRDEATVSAELLYLQCSPMALDRVLTVLAGAEPSMLSLIRHEAHWAGSPKGKSVLERDALELYSCEPAWNQSQFAEVLVELSAGGALSGEYASFVWKRRSESNEDTWDYNDSGAVVTGPAAQERHWVEATTAANRRVLGALCSRSEGRISRVLDLIIRVPLPAYDATVLRERPHGNTSPRDPPSAARHAFSKLAAILSSSDLAAEFEYQMLNDQVSGLGL
ncbi:MAG: hypothetical protein BJ554DRAFT_3597 [Olpidium bornovanus]|uniref:ATPase AAA-type core domain-containing protein n=1 Tax=Olpidium bornovanus TaxID=278681 RepID=A0A8H7ZNX9_9FUNG|nr:MAG: hypothetical protein BJ554DRAFT_3597 [Olpidium bornovanus]